MDENARMEKREIVPVVPDPIPAFVGGLPSPALAMIPPPPSSALSGQHAIRARMDSGPSR